jgi:hypothetical protein
MYIALFDESRDVVTRIIEFKTSHQFCLKNTGMEAGQHYQYENASSVLICGFVTRISTTYINMVK